jgi:hypothetical protein
MNSLPAELVLEIFDATFQYDRWALVATCRGFYKILNPLLYRQSVLYLSRSNPKKCFQNFFRTIQNNNHLANHVRELTLYGSKPASIYIGGIGEYWSANWEGEEWLIDLLPPLEQNDLVREGNMLLLQNWETSAMVALLMLRLKNLQRLHLGYSFWSDYRYLIKIFEQGEALRSLKKVYLQPPPTAFYPGDVSEIQESEEDVRSVGTKLFRHLLQLPCIESISCFAWEDRSETNHDVIISAFEPLEHPCNNLTYLRLPRSALQFITLNTILYAMPKLRRFDHHILIEADPDDQSIPIGCEEMDTALRPVRNTLEELSLGVHREPNSDLFPDIRGIMRSLPHFPKLTYLKIYYEYLLDPAGLGEQSHFVNLLPPTLRVLKVLGCNSCSYDSFGEQREIDYELLYHRLHEYANNKATHAPVLQYIDVICGSDFDNPPAVKIAYNRR